MFFSLNKKILYSLLAFLVFFVILFFIIFINMYSQQLNDSQASVYMRNQYVVNILVDNVRMKQQMNEFTKKYPYLAKEEGLQVFGQGLDDVQQELSNEQKLNEELRRNYNNNRAAMIAGAKVICGGVFMVVLLIFLLLFLLDYWVIVPIEKLTKVSHNVSAGIFSDRLPAKNNRFKDEFDILYSTFNNMLENTEQNIETTKNREKFLQELIDTIPEGIRVIDKNYNVIMANKAFYNLLNVQKDCVGEKCYKAYGYDCDGCPLSHYTCPVKTITEGKNDLHTIHEVGKIPLYVNAAKLMFGKTSGEYYIIESLHDLRGDILFSHQQKVSSLAFLSTSVAHEMKNNLGAIRLILEGVLNDDYKDISDENPSKKYLSMAYKQLIETVKTPERLLKLAQYSENEVNDIDVCSAVKDMMLMIDYDAKRRGIEVIVDVEADLSYKGNEADFKMIILNLAQNAIRAMPNGGTLRVSGAKSGKTAVIHIKDTGEGIDDEKIKHIFEPFYSANSREKSSGLGLAIVSSLVEKAQGSISVKSKVGRGTRFTLKFPNAGKLHS